MQLYFLASKHNCFVFFATMLVLVRHPISIKSHARLHHQSARMLFSVVLLNSRHFVDNNTFYLLNISVKSLKRYLIKYLCCNKSFYVLPSHVATDTYLPRWREQHYRQTAANRWLLKWWHPTNYTTTKFKQSRIWVKSQTPSGRCSGFHLEKLKEKSWSIWWIFLISLTVWRDTLFPEKDRWKELHVIMWDLQIPAGWNQTDLRPSEAKLQSDETPFRLPQSPAALLLKPQFTATACAASITLHWHTAADPRLPWWSCKLIRWLFSVKKAEASPTSDTGGKKNFLAGHRASPAPSQKQVPATLETIFG